MGLLGSIGKALFGGSKKTTSGSAQVNSTTVASPYGPAVPYLNDYLAQAAKTYNGGAPQISQQEQQGYDALYNEANNGTSAINPAIAENNKTLSGAYLDPSTNPFLADIASRMGGAAASASNLTFGGHGRTGSGLHEQNFNTGVASAVGDVYNTNYQNERQRMSGAVGMAPGLEQGRYTTPQAMISAGQNISARPFDIAQQYGGILGGIAGLGGTQTTNGTQTQQNYKQSSGLLGTIANSFVNKLFPG